MKSKFRPMLIGITGTIASGKSEVAKIFAENKFLVISTDEITKQLWQNKNVLEKIKKKFKTNDKEQVKNIVFADIEKLTELNNLFHPLIFKEISHLIANSFSKIIILEVPLLFEAKLEKYFDLIINVFAQKNILLQRLQKRNNLNKEQAEKIISKQFSDNYKIKNSDINIENNLSLDILHLQIKLIISMLSHLKKRKIKNFGGKL